MRGASMAATNAVLTLVSRSAAHSQAITGAEVAPLSEQPGAVRKRNRTENESAKVAPGRGVLRGYIGVAAVDGKHQIIVVAPAHGTGAEQEVLVPVVTALLPLFGAITEVTADVGSCSEATLSQLAAMDVTALIADNDLRWRDERFASQAHRRAGSAS